MLRFIVTYDPHRITLPLLLLIKNNPLKYLFQNESEDPNSDTSTWSSRYDDASASFVVYCAILMFFMVSRKE